MATAYAGFPEEPITLPKLARILHQLSQVETTQKDHERIATHLVSAMVDKEPKDPLPWNEVQKILDRFHNEPQNTKKEEFLEDFHKWTVGSKTTYSLLSLKQTKNYIAKSPGN